jgi:hypothetical protein
MKRIAWGASIAVLLAGSFAHARGTYEPSVNGLKLGQTSLKALDFESGEGLVGLELATWTEGQGGWPALTRTKIAKADDVANRLTEGGADAIEGGHALRLGDGGNGLAITDAGLFAQVKDGKFEVTLWGRADGTAPQLQVLYDRDAASLDTFGAQFANVRAVRTGRETTDGWAEFSTGPLDGNVWGVPVIAVLVLPSFYADAKDSFLLDALEITKLDGAPVAANACTQDNVDQVCGAEGDCMFGHCISSTVTWGALPAPSHRSEIAERWITFGTRLIGDRNAAQHGATILAPGARELAKSAQSSRQFYGGLNRLVNLLRDNHTSFGSPANYSSFAPQVQGGTSSALGACFGVIEKDIMGGGLAFGVFRGAEKPLTGVALKRGDIVTAIDGKDPKAWIDENWPKFATTLPNDPASDWGSSANDLARLVTMRASSITLARCAAANKCEGTDRETITVDVAKTVYDAIVNPNPAAAGGARFACSQRFSESVDGSGGGGYGEDKVKTNVGLAGETRVSFDGFVGQGDWESSMSDVFQGKPERVIMDARMGHGGYYTTVEHLFNLLRGTDEPMGVISIGRGTYDMTDPPWLFERYGSCSQATGVSLSGGSDMWSCFAGNANGFFASQAEPPGKATKIAWLNTHDVSANDFMPRLLQGRSGFKIFAPHPTSGAFGAIVQLPSLVAGWSGGSLQIQDARFAKDLAAAETVRWESGHGVPPDVVVVQTLSDALNGKDTILEAASAWLVSPNQ